MLILLVFSKNQLLDLWVNPINFYFSISLISVLDLCLPFCLIRVCFIQVLAFWIENIGHLCNQSVLQSKARLLILSFQSPPMWLSSIITLTLQIRHYCCYYFLGQYLFNLSTCLPFSSFFLDHRYSFLDNFPSPQKIIFRSSFSNDKFSVFISENTFILPSFLNFGFTNFL